MKGDVIMSEVENLDMHLVQESTSDVVARSMTRYALAAILKRAIPDVRDGLKPVHRRVLYTMHQAGVTSSKKHVKVATLVGRTMALHPHGDSSIADALVNLSQDWRQTVPLIEIEGNNGSIDGDSAAAMRYIEARLSYVDKHLMSGLASHSVDFRPSYDNESEEPVVLPVEFPLLFTNGTEGIAVGYATKIAPHHPSELLQAAICLNEQPSATLDDVLKYVQGPDFPTGCDVLDFEGIRTLYETGKGSFRMRGVVEKEKSSLIITAIPYGVTKQKVKESILSAIVTLGFESSVKSFEDLSEGDAVRLVLTCVRGTDLDILEQLLYKHSSLEVTFNANHLVIHQDKPVLMGLVDYLNAFLDFRRHVLFKTLKYEFDVKQKRITIVSGLLRLRSLKQEVIALMERVQSREDAIALLQSDFQFTLEQAEAIAGLRLYRLSNDYFNRLETEFKQLEARLAQLHHLATDRKAFRDFVTEELTKTLQTFNALPRRSILKTVKEDADILPPVSTLSLVPAQDVVVVLREKGIQKMSPSVWENNQAEFGSDVVDVLHTTSDLAVLIFTQKGFVIQRLISDIESTSLRQQPLDLHKEIDKLDIDDQLMGCCVVDIQDPTGTIVSVTEKGMAKRVLVQDVLLSFQNKGYLKRLKPYNGLRLEDDAVLCVSVISSEEDDVLRTIHLETTHGSYTKQLSLVDLPLQGATGSGRRIVKVTKEFSVRLLDDSVGLDDSDNSDNSDEVMLENE